jgi:hypothetical protein
MKIIKYISILFFFALLDNSCKKEDSDYLKKSDLIIKSGYITADIKGISLDSIALNESLKYEYINNDMIRGGSYTDRQGIKTFNFGRNLGFPVLFSDFVDIEITYDGINAKISNFTLDYEKNLGNNQILDLYLSDYYYKDYSLSNFSYDPQAGIIKGNYTAIFKYGDFLERQSTVIGEFDVSVTKTVSR